MVSVMDAATKQRYNGYLVVCMNLHDGTNHLKNYKFSYAQLQSLKPEDICAYMNLKAFGTPTPEEDAHPSLGRSSTLEYMKKAISFFMPDKGNNWDTVTQRGNPTKSSMVNSLIRSIKLHEVRREGSNSKAKQPIEEHEFGEMLRLFRKENVGGNGFNFLRNSMPAFCLWQYHLITRIDDVSRTQVSCLMPCIKFPFTLTVQMFWSKNIREERDAPHQILLGSMDPLNCIHIALAMHLESRILYNNGRLPSGYLIDLGSGNSPENMNAKVHHWMSDMFSHPEFIQACGDISHQLSSHSNRKFSATKAHQAACHCN